MKYLMLVILILTFGLVGYTQETPKEAVKSTPANSDKAIVYFYRVKEVAGIDNRKTKIKLDGAKIFEMAQAKWIGIRLAPGKYELQMRQKQSEMLLKVEAGKTYFVRVSEKAAGFFFNQSLTLMDAEQAVFQMRDLMTLESKRIFVKTEDVVTEKPVEENK